MLEYRALIYGLIRIRFNLSSKISLEQRLVLQPKHERATAAALTDFVNMGNTLPHHKRPRLSRSDLFSQFRVIDSRFRLRRSHASTAKETRATI